MTQHTTTHETPASLLAPLARGLLRRAPEIHFHWDAMPDKVEHVGQLLDQLKEDNQPKTETPDDSTD